MLFDYHIHTKLCGHAKGEPEEYLQTALKIGLEEIGFSDHAPLLYQPKYSMSVDELTMSIDELKLYVENILKIASHSEIPVRLGIEVDFSPNKLEIIDELKKYQFDYLIGSIHFLDGWGFDQKKFINKYNDVQPDGFFEKYYTTIQEMAKSKLFDIVAHFDLPKKFGIFPKTDLTDIIVKTLKIIKKNNMCIEVNTSGVFQPAAEIYPSEQILRLCFQLDIPLTLGSDSHSPENVGRYFNEAIKIIKKIGYKKLVMFHKRKKIEKDI